MELEPILAMAAAGPVAARWQGSRVAEAALVRAATLAGLPAAMSLHQDGLLSDEVYRVFRRVTELRPRALRAAVEAQPPGPELVGRDLNTAFEPAERATDLASRAKAARGSSA